MPGGGPTRKRPPHAPYPGTDVIALDGPNGVVRDHGPEGKKSRPRERSQEQDQPLSGGRGGHIAQHDREADRRAATVGDPDIDAGGPLEPSPYTPEGRAGETTSAPRRPASSGDFSPSQSRDTAAPPPDAGWP